MYKSILWIMGFLCLIRFANAQTAYPEVIASAGYSGTAYASWTIGESIVIPLDNGTLVLTQGFHQPDLPLVPVGIDREEVSLPPRVYPNPTSGPLSIDLASFKRTGALVKVVDAHGRLLQQRSLPPTSEPFSMDLSACSNGAYFIWVSPKDNQRDFVFRIAKIGFIK